MKKFLTFAFLTYASVVYAVGPTQIREIRLGQGTVTAPSIGPFDQTSTGWYFLATGIGVWSDTGVSEHAWGNDSFKQRSTGQVQWSSTNTASTGSNHDGWLLDAPDVVLRRFGAGHLHMGSLTLALTNQKFSLAEAVTDASNYEIGSIRMGSDTMTIGPETAGTGVDNMGINLLVAGTGSIALTGPVAATSTVTSSAAADLGWAVVDGTDNTACTAQCTSAAVFGFDLAAGASAPVLVGPAGATADICLCAGSS